LGKPNKAFGYSVYLSVTGFEYFTLSKVIIKLYSTCSIENSKLNTSRSSQDWFPELYTTSESLSMLGGIAKRSNSILLQ
jgi:hypothetical protein